MRVRGAFHLLLVCLSPALLPAVRISGEEQEVLHLAEGDSVKLGCPYILDPEDYGPNALGIEWMQVNPEPSRQENVFLSYRDNRVNHGDLPNLQQRVRFAAPDPSLDDASISFSNLQVSDTATYECRVKKTTVATRKVTITVLARPAVPMCSFEGRMSYGNDVVLKCFVSRGSPPITYRWDRMKERIPYRASSYAYQNSFHSEVSYDESFYSTITQGMTHGEWVLKDISYKDEGQYQCTVANRVGYSVCVVEVKVSGSWRIGIIIGAVLGSLLLLGCLTLGIWCLVRRCCRGPHGAFCCGGEDRRKACCDLPNDIREDDVAPGCKAKGRGSSVSQLLGYPMQKVRRSLHLQYAPPHCEGPEDLALASSAAAAALGCKEDQSPVCVKVKSAEPADCAAEGPLPRKDGLLV
ncbi:V-set and immunoglobulin domain-containing protein 8 [Physeter macrocephalus]|uniref:V-set and immunoglobulin domain-containing protein 8 n=1 Tax=Physeter macrocephalus TaxID=9755 RepID=UPI00042C906F|nr:V-set and immunoglobulin domain-containing protein 8 [Physeter catodon]|eukprot:XP_007129675.1 V-set and immunoglobulin domain-containing protein 8 [Physeter catodon]